MEFRDLDNALQRVGEPRLQCRDQKELFKQSDIALRGLVTDNDLGA